MLQKHCISCWEIKMSLSRSLSSGWGAYKWAQNNNWYVTQYSGVLGKKKKKKKSRQRRDHQCSLRHLEMRLR